MLVLLYVVVNIKWEDVYQNDLYILKSYKDKVGHYIYATNIYLAPIMFQAFLGVLGTN